MTFHFHILGSSSSGNASLLVSNRCRILIDAGFSCRRLEELLAPAGVSLEDLDAVFVTHEHSDHVAGLNGLAKLPRIRFFANRETAQAAQRSCQRTVRWQVFETGSSFPFEDLQVSTFSIPHDAYDPVGYLFQTGRPEDLFEPVRQVAWVTDLGYVPTLVRERVRSADVLVLESNHDVDLLDRDPKRPWSLKQRIKGRHGHLSNAAAAEFLASVPNPAWRHVYLAHLSRECNDVALVERHFREAPRAAGARYQVHVVDPVTNRAPPCDLARL